MAERKGALPMCLTTQALVLFLNTIIDAPVTTEPGRIIVHAETRDAHWLEQGDKWCTMAPQIDKQARLSPAIIQN